MTGRPARPGAVPVVFAGLLVLIAGGANDAPASAPADGDAGDSARRLELGQRMYMQGTLPSGEIMTATVGGDIAVTGEQAICGACHRRSGLGSSEGQEVVPAVTGDLLYEPLRLPTSKPPAAPLLRPAYTDETLKRAIRDGIDANGTGLSPFMPRYPLTDEQLDILIEYLKTLSASRAPGVTENEMHFATIVTDSVPPETREALLDVMRLFFEQKNTETRYESKRAEHPPWHKEWIFGPYRKWVLHVWDLEGPGETWAGQLEARYREQPVFAVLSGVAQGSWKPVHDFCEREQIPCLFPTTDLPVIDAEAFYSVYLSKGVALEAESIVQHLADEDSLGKAVVQVWREGDPTGEAAAASLQDALTARGGQAKNIPLGVDAPPDDAFWRSVLNEATGAVTVLWLGASDIHPVWAHLGDGGGPARIFLSTTAYGSEPERVPAAARDRVFFVHAYELPSRLPRLLARSTGWLRAKRIYAPAERRVQANAFFALKIAGAVVAYIRGFFNREYFLESVEHMVDNASYTSVYPRVSLAPEQRFVSKGAYIARPSDGDGSLVEVTDWLIPGSR